MNEQEWYNWKSDAITSLRLKYSQEETDKIMNFFERIKGKRERLLVGDENVDKLCDLFEDQPFPFNLYTSLMMRLWFYAPYILLQETVN